MRYQSDAGQDAGTVLACSIDGQHNWSPLVSYGCKIDWTVPENIYVADGQGQDIDSTLSQLLNGNWSAQDPHSGVTGYSFAIGTSPGGTDILNWSSQGTQQSMQHNLINPQIGTTYYLSIKAENNAGLIAQGNSDGQLYWSVAALNELNGSTLLVYPNPSNGSFTISGVKGPAELILYSMEGKIISTRELNGENEISVEGIATGNYWIELVQNGNRSRTKVVVL